MTQPEPAFGLVLLDGDPERDRLVVEPREGRDLGHEPLAQRRDELRRGGKAGGRSDRTAAAGAAAAAPVT